MRQIPVSGGLPPVGRDGYPPCPKCSRLMTIKQITPVLFATNVDDMIYGCDECGTELRRSIKRA